MSRLSRCGRAAARLRRGPRVGAVRRAVDRRRPSTATATADAPSRAASAGVRRRPTRPRHTRRPPAATTPTCRTALRIAGRLVLAADRDRRRRLGAAAGRRHVKIVIIPLAIALLLSALLAPAVGWLLRGQVPAVARHRAGAGRRPGRGDRHADPGGQPVHRRCAGSGRQRRARASGRSRTGCTTVRCTCPTTRSSDYVAQAQQWINDNTRPAHQPARSSTAATLVRGADRRDPGAVRDVLLPARRPPDLAVPRAAVPGGGPLAGRRRRAGIVGDAGRLRAGDRAGGLHRRGRHRHLPGDPRGAVRVRRWRRWSSWAPSSRSSVRPSPARWPCWWRWSTGGR